MNAWSDEAGTTDFRGPLDVTRAATVLLDGDSTVIGWSEAARELFGYDADDILGRPLETLTGGTAPRRPPFLDHDETANPACSSAARTVRHRDGHAVDVVLTICSLIGSEAPLQIMVAAALDPLRAWEAHQAMLRGLATQSPVGLGIYDTDLRLTWVNATYQHEIDRGVAGYSGKRVNELYGDGEVISDGHPQRLEDVMRGVLESGEPVFGVLYEARPPFDPEHEHVWSCAYYRLHDADGHVIGVCEDALDITERYRAQQRLALTVRAGVRIGTTLDMVTTAREIAEVVIPAFADGATVDLVEGVLEGEEPRALGERPTLLRVVDRSPPAAGSGEAAGAADSAADSVADSVAGAAGSGETGAADSGEEDPARSGVEDAAAGGEPYTARSGEPGTARSGEPGTAVGAEPDTAAGRPFPVRYQPDSPQLAALLSGKAVGVDGGLPPGASGAATVHSTLAVPLVARGATLGLVTFVRGGGTTAFDSGELALANELTTRTALSVDNARRYTRERASALTLQRNLLPRGLPEQSAVDVAHRYLPADVGLGVGGDWFDVITLSGTRVGLVVGDVVGHGVNAAATMGRLRTTVRALARLDLAPDELLSRLDDLVLQSAGNGEEPGDLPGAEEGLGVACLYAVYDPVSRRCTAARAGHPPPASVDPDGAFRLLDVPPGPPIGVGGLPFEAAETELPEGSLLALFTGGLVQDRDRDLDTGVAMLRGVLSGRDGSLEELCDRAISELQTGGPTTDDAALLLARTHELSPDRVSGWELVAEPSSVSEARSLVLDRLARWGLDELGFTTELVVSELVTNAVRHAVGPVYVRLIRDRSLHCEVSDMGHTSPNLRHSATDDEGGRGLFIVAQIVQRWGTRYTASGKTIWTEQALP